MRSLVVVFTGLVVAACSSAVPSTKDMSVSEVTVQQCIRHSCAGSSYDYAQCDQACRQRYQPQK